MNLKQKTVSGLKWTSFSSITLTIINILKIAVLARFLEKADFGLMALVSFVIGFSEMFMDMGLSTAILHKQGISKKEYASLYWTNIFLSLGLVLIILAISKPIAMFYGEYELQVLLPLASLSIFLAALGRQFKTVQQKELNFRYIALVDILGASGGLVVGVIMAIMGYGVYSLVFGVLSKHAISNLAYLLKGILKQGILLHFNYLETKPFLKIGAYQVGGQIMNYFSRDIDILLIGKLFGSDALGGYSIAKKLAQRPMELLNPITTRVFSSLFPRFQNDKPALFDYFIKLHTGLGAVYALFYGGIAIFASYIVALLYGNDFLSIVVYVQLFSVVYYIRSLSRNVAILSVTTGRTDYEFYWNLFITMLIPIPVIIGSSYSLETVIILIGIMQIVLLFPGWYLFYKRQINLALSMYLRTFSTPFVISLTAFIMSYLFFDSHIIWQVACGILLFISLTIYSYYNLEEAREYIDQHIIIT